jgi:CheY-like chemotaxis protein
VEANEFQCLQLSRPLGELGFQVASIRDGREALNEAKAGHPDVVISNPLVPGLDGFGLCVEFRKDPCLAKTPFIISPIATATEFDIELAQALGAAGYVSRTPNVDALIACVKMAMMRKLREEKVSNAQFSGPICPRPIGEV